MSWVQEIYLYRYFEAIYRTQIEYSGSVARQSLTTAFYNVSEGQVLTHVKSAISSQLAVAVFCKDKIEYTIPKTTDVNDGEVFNFKLSNKISNHLQDPII